MNPNGFVPLIFRTGLQNGATPAAQLPTFGWFRMFVASRRTWMFFDSLILTILESAASNDHCPGSSIVCLPSVPLFPGLGFCRRIWPDLASVIACRVQKDFSSAATAPHWGSEVLPKRDPKNDPLAPFQSTWPKPFDEKGPTTSGTDTAVPATAAYSPVGLTVVPFRYVEEMVAGCPVLALMMKLVCQPSTSRASTPELFRNRSLPGPTGNSNTP